MNTADQTEMTNEYLRRCAEVDYSVKLPDAECDVMFAIWDSEPPVTTSCLMKKLGEIREWKAPTLISFLVRLEDRGFIMSYKNGKERYYIPIAERDIYVSGVTRSFVERYHGGSFTKMLNSLYDGVEFSSGDIDELVEWLKTRY